MMSVYSSKIVTTIICQKLLLNVAMKAERTERNSLVTPSVGTPNSVALYLKRKIERKVTPRGNSHCDFVIHSEIDLC